LFCAKYVKLNVFFMNKKINHIYLLLLGALALHSCDMSVLPDPKAVSVEQSQTERGAYQSTLSALKGGLEAHQQMAWASGFIGNEEIQTLSATNTFLAANDIERNGKLNDSNGQNRTIAAASYQALGYAANARIGIEKITNATAKALLLANVNLIEGVIYGDLAKFYPTVPESGTGRSLSAAEARALAVSRLQEGARQFAAVGTNDLTLTGQPNVGLYTNATVGARFCNSFAGMLLYDAGDKTGAGPLLTNGYTRSEIGNELSYKIQNALAGDGIYPAHRNYVEFGVNKYSDKFIANRILADTSRRAPSRWWVQFTGTGVTNDLRTLFNYFFPQAVGAGINPAGSATVATYPVISWAEVALMRADLGQLDAKQTINDVLITWRISPQVAGQLSNDPTITLERVARYEYMGRGRRWAAVTPAYPKWDLPLEFRNP
jgi:hypothetical protein